MAAALLRRLPGNAEDGRDLTPGPAAAAGGFHSGGGLSLGVGEGGHGPPDATQVGGIGLRCGNRFGVEGIEQG